MFVLLIAVFLTFFLAAYFKNSKTKETPSSLKPLTGPPSVPFLGCLPFILLEVVNFLPNYEKMRRVSEKYANEYGFFAAQLGAQFCIHVDDYDTAREIMNSDDWFHRFNDHESFYERSFNKQIGLALGNGEGWKEVRKFTIKNLRQFGFGKGMTMESSLSLELETILEKMSGNIQGNNGIVDMHLFFNVSVLNLLWMMMVGERFSHQDLKLRNLLKLVDKVSKSAPQGLTPVFAFPFLRYIPNATEHDIILELHRQVQQLFRGIIEKRRIAGDYKDDPAHFIDVFLQHISNNNNDPKHDSVFNEQQLIMVCTDLFFTGSDTSSTSLEFAILYMILYPEVQQKVQQEIDAVIGRGRPPSLDDRKRLPYTEATILEALRFSSILPITARTSVRDLDLRGYFIPKGTIAGINLHGMHYSQKIWSDPQTFRPERFLNASNGIINADKVMPFGYGKRACMGETMARATVFIFFTALLQRYTFSNSPIHGPPSPIPLCGFTQYPRPYNTLVTLREES